MKTSKKKYAKKQAAKETLALAKFSFENPNPVLQFSDKGVLLYSNAASDAFLAMCDTDTRDTFMKDALRMIKEAGSVGLQKLIEIDCNEKTYSFVVIHIPGTNNINLYGQDITDRKKGEEKLRRSEERYRSLFDQMTEGFALYEIIENKKGVPVNYRFLEVNAAFENLTGLKREDVLFKLQSTVTPDEDPQFLKIYGTVAKTGIPTRFTNYSRILGRLYDIVAFSPEKGQVATIFNDITGKKQEEEAKNNFIAIMAHELRNPLMPIFTNTELLNVYLLENAERGHPVDAKIEESVGVIIRQTKTLARLLDDLLDISRIIHGKMALQKRLVDILPSAQNAIEATMHLIKSQKHIFSFSPPVSPIYIKADPIRIEQVITNLLTNAAKYTKPMGRISLTITKVDTIVEIKVKDTGIGIKSRDVDKIFELFVQFAKPFIETRGDFGFGLKIIKDIVTMHGGTIGVKSGGTNQGSEFIVCLPTVPPPDAKPETPNLPYPPQILFAKRKMLVVDDNKDISASLKHLLAHLGHEVEVANDGNGALISAENYKPELVILDIGLPDMTGYEVARRLRKKYGEALKLVALTGYGQQKDRLLSKEAGFNYHLTKPVSISDITKIIEKMFPAA